MPQKSSIEWTDYTSNPIYFIDIRTMKRGWFCVHCSTGCENCYAEQQNKLYNIERNTGRGNGLAFKAQNKQFVQAVMNEAELEAIIKLNNRLAKKGETAKLFCFDMTDLFGDFIPDNMRDKFFAAVALCENITFQILTKRTKEMLNYMTQEGKHPHPHWGRIAVQIHKFSNGKYNSFDQRNPFPNLWLGVSVEDQKAADERIPHLLQTPAAVRFLSCEPLLDEIDLTKYLGAKNEVEEKRGDSLSSSNQWGINNRQSRQNLEERQTSGAQSGRVFSNTKNVQSQEDICSSSSLSLSSLFRQDSRRDNDKPQEREQKRQSPREFRISDTLGTGSSRFESFEEESTSLESKRRKESSRETDLERSQEDSATQSDGRSIKDDCTGFWDSGSNSFQSSKVEKLGLISWTIVGGESGSHARPCNIDWIRTIVQQCKETNTPCFIKQFGSVPVIEESHWRKLHPTPLLSAKNRKKSPEGFVPLLMSSKGGYIEEFPADLRVREFPKEIHR